MSSRPVHIIGVIGARDGAGATTLAVNLSLFLKRETSKHVVLVDLDTDHSGDAAFLLGTSPAGREWRKLEEISALIGKVKSQFLSGYLTKHPTGVNLTGFGPQRLSPGKISELIPFLAGCADYLVLDLGSRWNACSMEVVPWTTEIWVVVRGDPVVLAGGHEKGEELRHAYYPGDRVRFVLNGLNLDVSEEVLASSLSERIGRRPDLILPLDGPRFSRAALEGNPLVLSDPRHAWTKAFEGWLSSTLLKKEGVPVDQLKPLSLQWPKGDPANGEEETSRGKPVACPGRGNTWPLQNAPEKTLDLSKDVARDALKEALLDRLSKKVNLKEVSKGDVAALKEQTTQAVVALLDEMAKEGPASPIPQDRKRLVEEILNEALGLGPLEDLLKDPEVSEIMVNAKDEIYVERKGRLSRTALSFTSEKQMMRAVERIVAPIGRRIDESSPLVDARLADGSRVNIVIPPLALKGPTITIRRFAKERLGAKDLIRFGAMSEGMAAFLKAVIEAHLNVIVSGGTGTGKTTLLNVLSSLIPNTDRIVTIEDAAELQLQQDHVVRLESRPANIEGKGAIEIRDLLKNALRMRPDRIVVGECRGGEALDMLQAMNTGHDGSLTTLHSNSPRDALSRLETLVMFAGVELPSRAIREQIAAGIHLLVQLKRFEDGSRKIIQITEVTGMEGDVIVLQDVFSFRQEGMDAQRKVQGRFVASGFIPKFLSTLQQRGIEVPIEIFSNSGFTQRAASGGTR